MLGFLSVNKNISMCEIDSEASFGPYAAKE